ncbi:SUKH-3 domain-containing protein [Myxococcus stipitatus]|uniref:SUKH-3 domain-containing protein n=1 Tax=Myxococcus stipitatus TaxID=83455 RepID=UPI0030D40594
MNWEMDAEMKAGLREAGWFEGRVVSIDAACEVLMRDGIEVHHVAVEVMRALNGLSLGSGGRSC